MENQTEIIYSQVLVRWQSSHGATAVGGAIEFDSGNQIKSAHPDAIRAERELFIFRSPDGGYVVFPADSVTRLLDVQAGT